MKHFYVSSQYSGTHRIIEAKTPRLACVQYIKDQTYQSNPKLFKIMVDSKDGKILHVGYGCGQFWLTVGEIKFFEKEV